MTASPACLFCRIVGGEIPADLVFENDTTIAFRDVSPQAPTHVLVIPKAHYENAAEQSRVDPASLGDLISVAAIVAQAEGVTGYRLVVNTGAEGGQSVFHTHLHLLAGRPFTWPPG